MVVTETHDRVGQIGSSSAPMKRKSAERPGLQMQRRHRGKTFHKESVSIITCNERQCLILQRNYRLRTKIIFVKSFFGFERSTANVRIVAGLRSARRTIFGPDNRNNRAADDCAHHQTVEFFAQFFFVIGHVRNNQRKRLCPSQFYHTDRGVTPFAAALGNLRVAWCSLPPQNSGAFSFRARIGDAFCEWCARHRADLQNRMPRLSQALQRHLRFHRQNKFLFFSDPSNDFTRRFQTRFLLPEDPP